MWRPGLLSMSLIFAGCSQEPADKGKPPPVSAPDTAEPEDQIAAPHPHGNFILTDDGFVVGSDGSKHRIAFGETRENVESSFDMFGPPTGKFENEECGSGPLEFTSWETLTLNFQDGKFVGWSVDHPNDIPMQNGLATGAPRKDVTALEGFRPITDSTLGDEFMVNGVSGIFGKNGVEHLWAGVNCIFR